MKLATPEFTCTTVEDARRLPQNHATRELFDRAITRAVRDEREPTARWLHDRTLQMLEYLAMGGYGLAGPEQLQALARGAADELRGLIEGDDRVDPTDLGAALLEVVGHTQLLAGSLCIRLVPGQISSTPDREQVAELTAGAREALSNVIRHAGAHSAEVTFGVDRVWAWVEIADDGAGFDPSVASLGRGLRHSVMARMTQAGGCARVQSSEAGGTVIRLQAPTRRWRPEAVSAA